MEIDLPFLHYCCFVCVDNVTLGEFKYSLCTHKDPKDQNYRNEEDLDSCVIYIHSTFIQHVTYSLLVQVRYTILFHHLNFHHSCTLWN